MEPTAPASPQEVDGYLYTNALDAADTANEKVRETYPETAEHQCTLIAGQIAAGLNIAGVKAEVVGYPGDWEITHHDFCLAQQDGQRYLIDGAWKQFIPDGNQEFRGLPDTIIAPIVGNDDVKYPFAVPTRLAMIHAIALKQHSEVGSK